MLSPGSIFASVLANGAATIGTGEAVLRAADQTRRSLVIRANAANTGTVYLGAAGVTTSTGIPLAAGDVLVMSVAPIAAMSAIASAAGQDVRFMEERQA